MVALVTIVNREKRRFTSKVGSDICETSRETSFCAHVILHLAKPLKIPDVHKGLPSTDNPVIKTDECVLIYAVVPQRSE